MTTVDSTHAPMNGMAAGWALSAVFVILFLVCATVALLWPSSALGQSWVALAPGGSIAAFVEGLLGGVVIAWLVAIVFVGVYNRMLHQSPR
jgi:hypothetical protein